MFRCKHCVLHTHFSTRSGVVRGGWKLQQKDSCYRLDGPGPVRTVGMVPGGRWCRLRASRVLCGVPCVHALCTLLLPPFHGGWGGPPSPDMAGHLALSCIG